jgi:hypothetical protein
MAALDIVDHLILTKPSLAVTEFPMAIGIHEENLLTGIFDSRQRSLAFFSNLLLAVGPIEWDTIISNDLISAITGACIELDVLQFDGLLGLFMTSVTIGLCRDICDPDCLLDYFEDSEDVGEFAEEVMARIIHMIEELELSDYFRNKETTWHQNLENLRITILASGNFI